MNRPILETNNIHPSIQKVVAENQADIVTEVQQAITNNTIVVIGMTQNPAPKRARKVLDELNIEYTYLEYGSYFKLWRRRNALKMWSGWPTFPIIFVKGMLIGGSSDLRALIESGELQAMLAATND